MSVLTARGAGVRHRRRWLFRDLDVTIAPGEIVAIVGPPGSGRTTVLLALAGRFRLSVGAVTIGGRVALGHVPEVTAPEPVFTVSDHIRERQALLGLRRDQPDLLGLEPAAKGRDLSPYERQLLGLILARLDDPSVIALDGLDDGLDTAEQEALLQRLAEIAATGTAIVFTAREVDAARVTRMIRLSSGEISDKSEMFAAMSGAEGDR